MTALSERWAGRHHRLLGSTTDDAIRLALALGVVKSAVRVVDSTTPPLSVDWAAVTDSKSASYTDFAGHAIRLNPMPILDLGIDHGRALDVCIGFALHEASHSEESRNRYRHLVKVVPLDPSNPAAYPDRLADRMRDRNRREPTTREVPAFEPMRVAAYLWNLVEDVRIERVTGSRWPGFAPYFGAVLDWMWTQLRQKHELPTEYSPTVEDRLKVVFLACRYPAMFTPTNLHLAFEVDWWRAWQHDYLTDAVDTPTTIQRGLDHLAEDAETAKELAEQADAERREREAGERLRHQIDRLIREGVGGFEVCSNEQGDLVPLDAETADAVRRFVRENLIETKTVVTAKGVSLAPVLVRKPTETPKSIKSYVGRPDAATEALRAALVFRASAPEHAEKLLKAGDIDDDELYRWGAGDMRVFGSRMIESKPDVFMGLLVDISGSMWGHKLEIAQRLAQLLTWAVHDQEGIETEVWAHTADTGDDDAAEVFRIWQRGDPLTRLGLLAELDNGNNRDGQAIEIVAGQIALREQPEKVLVVLSDGIPSGNGYGQEPAMDHVRAVTRWAAARGVRVIQIAIDPHDIRPQQQARMFGAENFIPFSGYELLPRQITSLLSRYL